MPKFNVTLVRDATQVTSVEVIADSYEEAEEAALDKFDNGERLSWDLSDDTGEPYVMEDSIEEI